MNYQQYSATWKTFLSIVAASSIIGTVMMYPESLKFFLITLVGIAAGTMVLALIYHVYRAFLSFENILKSRRDKKP